MTILTRLEQKIGFITIPGLPLYVVAAQGIFYIWGVLNPDQIRLMTLDMHAIINGGEYWRLFTFLFVVPLQNPVFAFFYLYLLYIYGSALENEWGSFPFTLYYLLGVLGTLATAFVFGRSLGTFFLNTTIFLAFAALYPDFRIYIFFILPVKAKWLAWLTVGWYAWLLIISSLFVKVSLLVSLGNYFLFFTKQHIDTGRGIYERWQHRRRFKDWNK